MGRPISDPQCAAVYRESRRCLRGDNSKPSAPPPAPEPLPREVEVEDPIRKWCREAEEREQERADAKAAMRQQEREAEDLHRAGAAQANDLEARVSALEQRMDDIATLANGSVGFSDAAVDRLSELETLTTKLSGVLETMRAVHERECGNLRAQLTAAETAHTRQMGLITKELEIAQRALDQRERKRDREQLHADIEATNHNIVALHRTIVERDGAA